MKIRYSIGIFLLSVFLSFDTVAQSAEQSKKRQKEHRHAEHHTHPHEAYEYTPHADDKDGDGVQDFTDKCPATPKGEKVTPFGCPLDTDFDGVYDSSDSCINDPGPAENHGCPYGDKDSDGVMDNVDDCPEVKGPRENDGCPYSDKDKDGILDADDKCPTVFGLKEFHGCPDTDGDGVEDAVDLCIDKPGPKSNRGCPEMNEKDKETIRKAFENLLFKTGESVILNSSYKSLNELGGLLRNNKSYHLVLEGHTDDVGEDESNMKLSDDRAKAVKKYLEDYGISASRIEAKGYGETQPIADNKTEAGRKLNRRVHMTIKYD